jgi:hypothetical protein
MNILFWQKEKIMQNNLYIKNNNYYFVALGSAEVQPTNGSKKHMV